VASPVRGSTVSIRGRTGYYLSAETPTGSGFTSSMTGSDFERARIGIATGHLMAKFGPFHCTQSLQVVSIIAIQVEF
jgi:hypothetical protein